MAFAHNLYCWAEDSPTSHPGDKHRKNRRNYSGSSHRGRAEWVFLAGMERSEVTTDCCRSKRECQEAQPNVVHRPAALCIAERWAEQADNLVDCISALRFHERVEKRARKGLEPAVHVGGQSGGARNQFN